MMLILASVLLLLAKVKHWPTLPLGIPYTLASANWDQHPGRLALALLVVTLITVSFWLLGG